MFTPTFPARTTRSIGQSVRRRAWCQRGNLRLRSAQSFRNSFDRATGDFFIADVGQNALDEINFGQPGANYGWNTFEGPELFPGGSPLGGPSPHTPPIQAIPHSVGRTVIGGYVYRGGAEALQGQLIFRSRRQA
jgi:hypothetical protein